MIDKSGSGQWEPFMLAPTPLSCLCSGGISLLPWFFSTEQVVQECDLGTGCVLTHPGEPLFLGSQWMEPRCVNTPLFKVTHKINLVTPSSICAPEVPQPSPPPFPPVLEAWCPQPLLWAPNTQLGNYEWSLDWVGLVWAKGFLCLQFLTLGVTSPRSRDT